MLTLEAHKLPVGRMFNVIIIIGLFIYNDRCQSLSFCALTKSGRYNVTQAAVIPEIPQEHC